MVVFASQTILEDLALVFAIAAVVTVVFHKIRQPVVVGYLVAGIIVGPFTPVFIASTDRIHTVAELGVILLMFALGLEFNIRKLLRLGPTASFVTAIQVGLMFWIGDVVASAMGWTPLEGIFAGAMLSISSTTIVAKAFGEQNMSNRVHNLVFGILLAEDMTAVMLLAILTAIAAGKGLSPMMMFSVVSRLALFLVILIGVGLLIVPWGIRKVVKLGRPETTLITAIGICFVFAMIAEHAGYSVALGAFLAGSLVAESGDAHTIEHLVEPVRDLFGAVFFVSVGMMIEPAQVLAHWAAIAILVAVVILGKMFGVTLACLMVGTPVRPSVQTGMSLTQIGEFSFIIAGVGIQTHATREFIYTIAVAVSAITTFTTPYMIGFSRRTGDFVATRVMPENLGALQVIYDSLMERIRSMSAPERGIAWPSTLLGAGALAIGAILILNEMDPLDLTGQLAALAAVSYFHAGLIVDLGALAVCAPFIWAMYHGAGRLAHVLAARTLASPRGTFAPQGTEVALEAVLHSTILLVITIPLLGIVQPFLEPIEGIGAIVIGTILIGVVIWRSTLKLRGNLGTVAGVIAAAFAEKGTVPYEVPGFGTVTPVQLETGAAAIGRSLAQLKLRAITGATAVVLSRHRGAAIVPTGSEILAEGDVLGLAGPVEQVEAARHLLLRDGAAQAA